jgi:heme-degrading monooxygenase HmoA
VETIDGFISVERFQSVTNPNKYLSLSFWRDEKAVKIWRNLFEHRQAQKQGRSKIFKDYRLRVSQVIRDYGMNDRDRRPEDSSIND